MTTGKLLIGTLTRLSISRCAVWAQAEHRKVWRSIPHTVVLSGRTSVRRISALHAKHFIRLPPTPSTHVVEALMMANSLPSAWWHLTAMCGCSEGLGAFERLKGPQGGSRLPESVGSARRASTGMSGRVGQKACIRGFLASICNRLAV
jgi:hypothetical protein